MSSPLRHSPLYLSHVSTARIKVLTQTASKSFPHFGPLRSKRSLESRSRLVFPFKCLSGKAREEVALLVPGLLVLVGGRLAVVELISLEISG